MNNQQFLVGLIGADIQMSKSPALHEVEGRHQGLDYRYELLDLTERSLPVSALPALLDEEERRGFAGSNITHPCKQTVIAHLTQLSEDAEMLGAVNTVVFQNGERIGHNTDWYGFYKNFECGLPDVARSRAVLLGAGGAGVAVAHAAIKLGIERLSIFDRDSQRAERLASQLNDRFSRQCADPITDIGAAMRLADGLIHATPTGMKSHPGLPIDAVWLDQRHWVADIVYMPLETELLALARKTGCRTLPGGGMTVFQAAAAFKLFTGIEPDAERMSRHFAELCRATL
ncbi:shikimate dehydrogenase [Neorhizobium galegae]|uniref:shikimate dehydrogenase n=1 Tax=Neorhizobium galegae TaxID=399 RepID=UPI00278617A8|nr:shikimate dehydrogenase [Neorhizobium galegae]MDQ0134909.1 shikimate dehydrogenase [Neorhizobium galegae]